jgi:hypothetical protein
MRASRRRFIQAGAAGIALLATVRWLDAWPAAPAARLKKLDARAVEMLEAVVPVVLAGALPEDAGEKSAAVAQIIEGFDRALSGLDPAIQDEIGQMLGVLVYAPTRITVAGVWSPWKEASAAEIAAFLGDWRGSRYELKRSGYRALTQLIKASWYDNPAAWRILGYPGPPQVVPPGTT